MISLLMATSIMADFGPIGANAPPESQYRNMYDNDSEIRKRIFSIVACDFQSTTWEKIWLTRLRDKNSSLATFRAASNVIGELLVQKIINCLHIEQTEIETTLAKTVGYTVKEEIELVSVMRSGDCLAEMFIKYFANAPVSKFLIQRNPKTHKPEYIYKKLSKTIGDGNTIVICEPMVATGLTLTVVIDELKELKIDESKIIIASIVASPEAIDYLSRRYPRINLIMIAIDSKINEQKYIVPGLGDFGDRYYGTE